MRVQLESILERLVLDEVAGSVAAAAHVMDFCVCTFVLVDLCLPTARLLYDDDRCLACLHKHAGKVLYDSSLSDCECPVR